METVHLEVPQYFNLCDVFIVCIIFFSAFVGFCRGFIREIFGVGAWGLSGLLAYHDFPWTQELFSRWMSDPFLIQSASRLSVFCVSLMVLMFFAQWASAFIQNSMAKSMDSSLGIVLGVLRGSFFVVLGYAGILFFMTPDNHPIVIQSCKSLPMIQNSVLFMEKFLPSSLRLHPIFQESIACIKKKHVSSDHMTQNLSQPPLSAPSSPPPSSPESH